jgi:hypothetical protein
MPKSSLDMSSQRERPRTRAADLQRPRDGSCELYAPGHQMHYQHQGHAVRSPSVKVANAILDGVLLTLVLEEGGELQWRHHDPARLRRILDLVPSSRVAYPHFHALRVGPYWFNCATEADGWQPCGLGGTLGRP